MLYLLLRMISLEASYPRFASAVAEDDPSTVDVSVLLLLIS